MAESKALSREDIKVRGRTKPVNTSGVRVVVQFRGLMTLGINFEVQHGLVLCSQSLFRFADLGDDGLCRGGPDKGCGVIVSAIDVVVDRLD